MLGRILSLSFFAVAAGGCNSRLSITVHRVDGDGMTLPSEMADVGSQVRLQVMVEYEGIEETGSSYDDTLEEVEQPGQFVPKKQIQIRYACLFGIADCEDRNGASLAADDVMSFVNFQHIDFASDQMSYSHDQIYGHFGTIEFNQNVDIKFGELYNLGILTMRVDKAVGPINTWVSSEKGFARIVGSCAANTDQSEAAGPVKTKIDTPLPACCDEGGDEGSGDSGRRLLFGSMPGDKPADGDYDDLNDLDDVDGGEGALESVDRNLSPAIYGVPPYTETQLCAEVCGAN